jgi:hypothetical protein
MARASGSFEVKIVPQTSEREATDPALGRMSIDKEFSGDLKATSKGQMLTSMTDANGAAVYVALERVTGALNGKRGSFVLYHNGTATRARRDLVVKVAPDSGTEELLGIDGSMSINIVEKKHFYEFNYTLPAF